MSASQADRLLEGLRDRRWWSSAELCQLVSCIVHSRIAELRRRGHTIEHRQVGTGASGHLYRLVASAELMDEACALLVEPAGAAEQTSCVAAGSTSDGVLLRGSPFGGGSALLEGPAGAVGSTPPSSAGPEVSQLELAVEAEIGDLRAGLFPAGAAL